MNYCDCVEAQCAVNNRCTIEGGVGKCTPEAPALSEHSDSIPVAPQLPTTPRDSASSTSSGIDHMPDFDFLSDKSVSLPSPTSRTYFLLPVGVLCLLLLPIIKRNCGTQMAEGREPLLP